jgi:hypothetical protein
VATKDQSRCIDFAYDPELKERTTQHDWAGLLYLLQQEGEGFWQGVLHRDARVELYESRAGRYKNRVAQDESRATRYKCRGV